MKEYIERAAVCKACKASGSVCTGRDCEIPYVPVADVVEVVRCKNCRFFSGRQECYCHAADENGTPIFVREDDYCSYDVRMDKEDEHG